jgi:dUTPase
MFDVVNNGGEDYWGNKYDRYIQICAPSLMPIVIEVVSSVAELGNDTSRGAGAFGSTGK